MTISTRSTFIDQIDSLPPLPTLVQRILAVTEDPTASAKDVARVLSEDPAIAAKILHVANSSFYGMRSQISQVSRAVVILGSIAVRNLVVAICTRDALSPAAAESPDHTTLWRHSVAVAAGCELIAKNVGFRPPEEAFVAGLLHDVGQLAMVTFQPQAMQAIFRQRDQDMLFLELERKHLGIDHTEAGYQILHRWGLPKALCLAVKQHHVPEMDANDDSARLLALVILADIHAHMLGFGFDFPVGSSQRADVSAQLLGLTESDQMQILDALQRRAEQAIDMFADADVAAASQTLAGSSNRITWISSEKPTRRSVAQLLLEQQGYEVHCASPTCLDTMPSPDDTLILDLPGSENGAIRRLLQPLAQKGIARIIVLVDPQKGAATRLRDKESGACYIPRLFTTFDLKWVQEQFQR